MKSSIFVRTGNCLPDNHTEKSANESSAYTTSTDSDADSEDHSPMVLRPRSSSTGTSYKNFLDRNHGEWYRSIKDVPGDVVLALVQSATDVYIRKDACIEASDLTFFAGNQHALCLHLRAQHAKRAMTVELEKTHKKRNRVPTQELFDTCIKQAIATYPFILPTEKHVNEILRDIFQRAHVLNDHSADNNDADSDINEAIHLARLAMKEYSKETEKMRTLENKKRSARDGIINQWKLSPSKGHSLHEMTMLLTGIFAQRSPRTLTKWARVFNDVHKQQCITPMEICGIVVSASVSRFAHQSPIHRGLLKVRDIIEDNSYSKQMRYLAHLITPSSDDTDSCSDDAHHQSPHDGYMTTRSQVKRSKVHIKSDNKEDEDDDEDEEDEVINDRALFKDDELIKIIMRMVKNDEDSDDDEYDSDDGNREDLDEEQDRLIMNALLGQKVVLSIHPTTPSKRTSYSMWSEEEKARLTEAVDAYIANNTTNELTSSAWITIAHTFNNHVDGSQREPSTLKTKYMKMKKK